MKFRTEIACAEGADKIDHQSGIVLLGSCFSEHINEKFQYFKFDSFINPFGILFNPVAIETAVQHCVDRSTYSKKDLLEHGDTWLSLDHHSTFDQRNPKQVLADINREIENGHQALLKASHVIITLGTSWAYQWKEDQRIVGNCHKIPQRLFNKKLLSSDEILASLKQIIFLIRSINKQTRFIFTVSPVRHLKDGFIENTLSKSLLHKAIHDIIKEEEISYFPSYEIMMDDLRDYRFYQKDLVHPNDMAVDYIWTLFSESWISKEALHTMNDIEEIQKSLAHRPFDPDSEAHKLFLAKLEKRIQIIEDKFPQINFNKKRK